MDERRDLEVGMCILIRRSDGTVHEAVVSELREQTLLAEWTERGECKGKEVPLGDVLLYNQHLRAERPPRSKSATDLQPERRGMGSRSSSAKLLDPVRAVERLRRNRDERRLQQAKRREEKQLVLKMNPDNPNWEYLNMISDIRKTLSFGRISDTGVIDSHQITVCVRKRPLNHFEVNKKEVDVVTVLDKEKLIVHEPKCKVDLTKFIDNQHFKFDYVFDENCSNDLVYKYTAKPLIDTVFGGGVATCFAYGQTGSGKTYTMGGNGSSKSSEYTNGIYAKTAYDIFSNLHSCRYEGLNLSVTASYFEIYREKLFDLLAGKAPLRVYEDLKQQVNVIGLTERGVSSVEEILSLIKEGNMARTSGKTDVNQMSSRSHAVFQITLRPPNKRVHGKLCMIDLAGNERGSETINRKSKIEGADINKSLLALKECIRALGRKDAYLPFRGSKLTQVLRDAFIGDKAKTCMIAMLSPGLASCKNSLNTLRYADRVKELATSGPPSPRDSTPQEQPQADGDASPLPLHLSWYEKKEKQLRDECSCYLKSSFNLNKKEVELFNSDDFEKFPLKDFVTNLTELLNERLFHTKQLLNLAEDVTSQLHLKTLN